MQADILAALGRKNYVPLKPRALARKLGVTETRYPEFRTALKELLRRGRIILGRNQTVRQADPLGTVTGTFRRTAGGPGFVRPGSATPGPDVYVPPHACRDAATGDEVLVKITRKPRRGDALGPAGEVVRVLERATRQFVGGYFERDGRGYVRVDGDVFSHSVRVDDADAKGARHGDQVVVEMVRFPTADERGEGVIAEVLGKRGDPGVDTISVIRAFGLPDRFPDEVLNEARAAADAFDETSLAGRTDFTADLVVTIDPPTAADFDDAVSLTVDPATGHWLLNVHVADVSHFVPVGGALDGEARKRGTSVYLPRLVLPMFPELISNSLASLQEGKLRYVKSAVMEFTADGKRVSATFAEGAIRVRKRLTYEEVSAFLKGDADRPAGIDDEVAALLPRMRDLAMILRKRRLKRGALELVMPKAQLEYDDEGRVSGAHFEAHDVSHQIIEEFMLAANEAVARHLNGLDVPFLRRTHPAPEPTKLEAFVEFARILGYKVDRRTTDRFTLQRILREAENEADGPAVNYALLRSLKQAAYAPTVEEHYALASDHYCHFTSPIRRYPDLTVHRLLGRWIRTGKVSGDLAELQSLGDHCSRTERRAETAERELVKAKLLAYMENRLGEEFDAVISGVADYGFFAQGLTMPVEGLVHVSTLDDDFYHHDDASHTLEGRRHHKRYRLGDRVRVQVVRVDRNRRQLDFRLAQGRKRERPERG